jgi:hypothetical protein
MEYFFDGLAWASLVILFSLAIVFLSVCTWVSVAALCAAWDEYFGWDDEDDRSDY